MTLKHILLGVALLTQCLALHALTEEDIATLDAAFEATFREGPTCGINVWVDPAKVPTNYTEWAYALTTREGCLGRFRRHLPQGVTYSDDSVDKQVDHGMGEGRGNSRPYVFPLRKRTCLDEQHPSDGSDRGINIRNKRNVQVGCT